MRSVPEHPGVTTLGLDLRSAPRYPTGLAVMDADRRVRWLAVVRADEEILEAVERFAPACIAIDAPLGLPEGRCCADPACACAAHGIMRVADRVCAAAGFRPFPTLLPSMVKLTLRGISLYDTLSGRGHRVIEVYPGMAQDVLAVPRKRAGSDRLRRGLKRNGVLGLPRGRPVSHDELDAVTCALVAQLHLAGETETMGPGVPVPLVLPRRGASHASTLAQAKTYNAGHGHRRTDPRADREDA